MLLLHIHTLNKRERCARKHAQDFPLGPFILSRDNYYIVSFLIFICIGFRV